MNDILYGEWLKLKRSRVVGIGFLGTLVVPIFVIFKNVQSCLKNPGSAISLFSLYDDALVFLMLLFAPLVMSIFAVYLISREYSEKTLKTVFSVPVSRKSFLAGKFLMLFMIIELFMLLSWLDILVLAAFCSFFVPVGLAASLQAAVFLARILLKMLYSGAYVYMTITPVVYLSIRSRGFLVPFITVSAVCLLNVLLSGSPIAGFFPWTAAFLLVQGHGGAQGGASLLSFVIIAAVCALSVTASMVRFAGEEV